MNPSSPILAKDAGCPLQKEWLSKRLEPAGRVGPAIYPVGIGLRRQGILGVIGETGPRLLGGQRGSPDFGGAH